MGNFGRHIPQPSPHLFRDLPQQMVAVKLLPGVNRNRRIQPTQQCLSLRVNVVVQIHRRLLGLDFAGHDFKPLRQALSLPDGNGQHSRPRKFRSQTFLQSLQRVGLQQVDFVHHNQVGFLQLFPIDVDDLWGKTNSFGQSQHALRPNRIHQRRKRRNLKIVAVNAPQRIRHRSLQIRATAHRLGHKHFRPSRFRQTLGRLQQRVKPTAKTAPRNLLRGVSRSAQGRRVHQSASLIVGDQPRLASASGQILCQLRHRRRLAGAQKTPNHNIPRRRLCRRRLKIRHPCHCLLLFL